MLADFNARCAGGDAFLCGYFFPYVRLGGKRCFFARRQVVHFFIKRFTFLANALSFPRA